MAIPDFQTIMLTFIRLLNDQQTWTTRDLTDRLAVHFELTESERHQLLPSGQQAIFTNRVAWAKSHLKNAGLILNPSRGNGISKLTRLIKIAFPGLRKRQEWLIGCVPAGASR